MDEVEQYMQIVAWRVKDLSDGWILFDDEGLARFEAGQMGGALIEPLYRMIHKSEE